MGSAYPRLLLRLNQQPVSERRHLQRIIDRWIDTCSGLKQMLLHVCTCCMPPEHAADVSVTTAALDVPQSCDRKAAQLCDIQSLRLCCEHVRDEAVPPAHLLLLRLPHCKCRQDASGK